MNKQIRIPIVKMQGVGNDFVLVDARAIGQLDWPSLAQQVCDRHFGIGADGLLVVADADNADATMLMFNPDGTPDICGNGLRCVARYVAETARESREADARYTESAYRNTTQKLLISIANPLIVPGSQFAIREAQVRYDSEGSCSVVVGMGLPEFNPSAIPMDISTDRVMNYPLLLSDGVLHITALSTGSTHAVTFVPELPDDTRFISVSREVENHPLFPQRTSLMWVKVVSQTRLQIRIWERGADETWGCGTGACAAAIAAKLHGYVDGPVTVASRGGELRITWREGETIRMEGPAEYVFRGVYHIR